MVFSSLVFLYAFLPAVLLTYFIAPKFLKNTVLLLFSLAFYAWGEPKYLVLILVSIAQGYICGLLIERSRGSFWSKLVLALSIVGSLGLLGYFKYANFLLTTINEVIGSKIPLLKLALPVGISFYTFQILSYTVDVYRGTAAAQKNPIDFGAYVVLFPQLIAGPIVRYQDIAHELTARKSTLNGVYDGAVRFLIGLGKKVLLANQLGAICAGYRASVEPTVVYAWLSSVAFLLQIYFDFSGYSDMAIGMGKILGFHFPENFDHPYTSKTITEFWRRWHMSLGTWFRDYVYIPLGGNRVKKLLWLRNILVVWCLTGLWHGAGWNFLLWGLMFAVLLMVEKLFYGKFMQNSKIVGHIYVIGCLLFSFVLFNGTSMAQIRADFSTMFGLNSLPFLSVETTYALRSSMVLLIFSAIGATALPVKLYHRLEVSKFGPCLTVLQPIGLILILLVSTAFLVDGSFNPFLYFRF